MHSTQHVLLHEVAISVAQYPRSKHCSNWARGWTTRVQFLAGAGMFSLCHHIQMGYGAPFEGVEQLGYEADSLPLIWYQDW